MDVGARTLPRSCTAARSGPPVAGSEAAAAAAAAAALSRSLPQLHWGPRFFGRSSCSLIGATFLRQFLHASRGICFLRFEAFCEMSLSKKSKILPSVRPSVPLFFKEKAAEGTRKETRDRPERVKRARARTAPAFSSGGSRRPRARMPSSLPLCSLGSLSHFVALSSFGGKRSGGR